MSEEPDLIRLLFRADWTRLRLAAEVTTRPCISALDRGNQYGVGAGRCRHRGSARRGNRRGPGTSGKWPPISWAPESSRSTLLIAPGRRYREQGEDLPERVRRRAEPGSRSRTTTAGRSRPAGGPEPPLPSRLLRPSWLLTGFTLEAGGPVTVRRAGRAAGGGDATAGTWPRASAPPRPLDRVEVAGGRSGSASCSGSEEILDGKTLGVTELTEIRVDPDPGRRQRAVPAAGRLGLRPRRDAAEDRAARPRLGGEPSSTAGLAAGGLGALIRSARFRPFEQATQEEPEAEMPASDAGPLPADARAGQRRGAAPAARQPGPLGAGDRGHAAPVARRRRDCWPRSRTARGARVSAGSGYLIDAAGERVATLRTVSRLSLGGSGQYRIEPACPPNSPRARSGTGPRRSSATGSGSGRIGRGRGDHQGRRAAAAMRSRSCSTPPGCSVTTCPAAPRSRPADGPATGSASRPASRTGSLGPGASPRRGCGGRRTRHPAPLGLSRGIQAGVAVRAARCRRSASRAISGSTSVRVRGWRKNRTTSRPARPASRRRWRASSPGRRPGTRDQRSGACSAACGAEPTGQRRTTLTILPGTMTRRATSSRG